MGDGLTGARVAGRMPGYKGTRQDWTGPDRPTCPSASCRPATGTSASPIGTSTSTSPRGSGPSGWRPSAGCWRRPGGVGAAFVLATGDQFDGPNPDPDTVRGMLDRIGAFPEVAGPPDPRQPRSRRAGVGLHPVRLPAADEPACPPGTAAGPAGRSRGDAVPLPVLGPVRRRPDDLDRPATPTGTGCGSAWRTARCRSSASADARNYPIAADAPTRYDLDYVALGDWHAPIPCPDDRPGERMYYAGAPEIGGWDEPGAGTALLVDLEPESAPRAALLRVGGFAWHDLAPELRSAADVAGCSTGSTGSPA